MKTTLTTLFICWFISTYSQNFPYTLNKVHPHNPCDVRVKVGENRPTNCIFWWQFCYVSCNTGRI